MDDTVSRGVMLWRDIAAPISLGLTGLVLIGVGAALILRGRSSSAWVRWWPVLCSLMLATAIGFPGLLLLRLFQGPYRASGPDSGWSDMGLIIPWLGVLASWRFVFPASVVALTLLGWLTPIGWSVTAKWRVRVSSVLLSLVVTAAAFAAREALHSDWQQRRAKKAKANAHAAAVQKASQIASWGQLEKQLVKDEQRVTESVAFLKEHASEMRPEDVERWRKGIDSSKWNITRSREMIGRIREEYGVTDSWEEAAERALLSLPPHADVEGDAK